jgi:(p)ppGpp synthase/HD superfamily hydrolase
MKAETLEAVIRFTDHAHGDQMRRYTHERYIVHPVRVMQICQQYTHDPAILTAALLHDVLEDTPVSAEAIAEFLDTILSSSEKERAMRYVVELTDVYVRKDYPEMNRQTRRRKEAERLSVVSGEAQTIKYADIMDNSVCYVLHDQEFGYVYLKESKIAIEAMRDGHPALRERALHTVTECMEKVKKIER